MKSHIAVPVTINWAAATSATQFTGSIIQTSIDNDGNVNISIPPGNFWATMKTTKDDSGAYTATILEAVNANQLFDLPGKIVNDGEATELQLVDTSGLSQFVDTTFHVVVKSGGGFLSFINVKRFEGDVDPSLVDNTSIPGTIRIYIGKLPGIKAKKLWSNKKIKVALTVTRSLGGQAKTQELDFQRKKE